MWKFFSALTFLFNFYNMTVEQARIGKILHLFTIGTIMSVSYYNRTFTNINDFIKYVDEHVDTTKLLNNEINTAST